jgi:aminoglycoside phosphotransferase (APT) family kinase protein
VVDEAGLVAVLDWELVHAGNPVEDLGWLCTKAWPRGRGAAPGRHRRAVTARRRRRGAARFDDTEDRLADVLASGAAAKLAVANPRYLTDP